MDGVLVVDKPAGPTSHDIVARARRLVGEPRVGHTGTLDPAASGVLPLVMGRATRLARFFAAAEKSYEAIIRLGYATDTDDAEGVPGPVSPGPLPGRADIEEALAAFRGAFEQRPPVYSAKRVAGRRSHRVARAAARPGAPARARAALAAHTADLAPVRVRVDRLDLVDIHGADVTVTLTCSAGFYVRALARDLGERLGVGGHLIGLRRTRSGEFRVDDALAWDAVERDPALAAAALTPMSRLLLHVPAVTLTPEGVRHACHGRDLTPADLRAGGGDGAQQPDQRAGAGEGDAWVRLLAPDGSLVGLARRVRAPGLLHPSVVLR